MGEKKKVKWYRSCTIALLLSAIVVISAWQMVLVSDWRVDDAYITFSYSKNLAQGRGPIYSHDVQVEGYSNFLWMLLLAFAFRLAPAVDPYLPARLLALAFLVLGYWATYRLMRRRAGLPFAAMGIGALAMSSDLMRATVSGLETTGYTALLALAVLCYLREPRNKPRWSLLAFLPVALMRIDGIVPVFFLVAFEFTDALYRRRLNPRIHLRWLAWFAVPYLVYFAWRWSYYGLLFPTTYYAKTLVESLEPNRGVFYAVNVVRDLGLLAVLPFAVLAVALRPSRDAVLLGALCAFHAVYVIHVGGDWMPFWRFWIPIAPLAFTLLVWGLQRTLYAMRFVRVRPRLRTLTTLLLLFPLAFVAKRMDAHTIDTPEELRKLGEAEHVRRHTGNELLGDVALLRWAVRAPGDLLVTDYGGVFAFYTDASVIEMWGLCNASIALTGNIEGINPIYGKTCVSCYKQFNPDYFHVKAPMLRNLNAFADQNAVINAIFQGPAIGRYIDLHRRYAAGRVVDTAKGTALYFLERRRPDIALFTRQPHPGIVVEYPFEK